MIPPFFGAAKCQLNFTDETSLDMADVVRITWCIQKNQQNGQTITLSRDKIFPILCSVRCVARMILRAKRLKQPNSMPVGCYRTKETPPMYMTANWVATLIRERLKMECLGITTADRNKYSTHSLRVWACLLLDEVGKVPTTSENTSAGWAICFACTSMTHGHTRHAPWGTSIVITGDHCPSWSPTQRHTSKIYNEPRHTWWQHGWISWQNGLILMPL